MEKLSTIQKREKLNDVYAIDEKGPGGAYHEYVINYNSYPAGKEQESGFVSEILFQKGPRKLPDSVHGVLDTDLLEIVRHRLQCFQAGEFSTRENELALMYVEQALLWLNRRVEERIERNVLGTNEK